MLTYETVCICGGGGLGHTLIAALSEEGTRINLLTGHPQKWSDSIIATDCFGKTLQGNIARISGDPAEVIPEADIVLLCVPGFLIGETLRKIAPYVNPSTEVGTVVCSNGFFWIARDILGDRQKLFGFQRVPFISRVVEYGKSALLKGYKSNLKIGGNVHSDLENLAIFFSEKLQTPTTPLQHYLEATLTNSNPILHPARIYGMLSPLQDTVYEKEFLFYEEWDDFSSEILIQCDNEFQNLLTHMPIDRKEIPSLLSYYESTDAASLTRKIRSITAFKGIKMSMSPAPGGYTVNYTNRYFTEDIPYGLLIIKSIALLLNQPTPSIDMVLLWMQKHMNKEYLVDNRLMGMDCPESGIVQNFQIYTESQLYNLNS